MSRRKSRECALTVLYQLDISMDEKERVIKTSCQEIEEPAIEFFTWLVEGVLEKMEERDSLISTYLKENWTLNRLSIIDRTILRLAVFEMTEGSEAPGVAINEAVKLAKKYSSMESSRFINGILGKLSRDL